MKKIVLLVVMCLISKIALASPAPSVAGIRDRLVLRADIYELDSSGKKIVNAPDSTSTWQNSESIHSDWSISSDDRTLIAIRHSWTVQPDGSIKVSIEEFKDGKSKDKPGFQSSLKKSEFTLENFAPVIWQSVKITDRRFVIRFIPSLEAAQAPIQIEHLPISGKEVVVTDSAGYVWIEQSTFNGIYSGFATNRGGVVMSYQPFDGAKQVGIAEGNRIDLKFENKFVIHFRSRTDFVPAGTQAKVYALYLPELKSKLIHSVYAFDSNEPEKIKRRIKDLLEQVHQNGSL